MLSAVEELSVWIFPSSIVDDGERTTAAKKKVVCVVGLEATHSSIKIHVFTSGVKWRDIRLGILSSGGPHQSNNNVSPTSGHFQGDMITQILEHNPPPSGTFNCHSD